MDCFANPFQGLIAAATKPDDSFKIITDCDYIHTVDDFVTAYEGFKQRDYIQLPGKLIQASEISKYIDKIELLSIEKWKQMNENILDQKPPQKIVAFDDRKSSRLHETMDSSEQGVNTAFDDMESISSFHDTMSPLRRKGNEGYIENYENQSYSPSEVSSSLINEEENQPDVFKVPYNKMNSNTRDYNNHDSNKSDASSDTFDDKTIASNSDKSYSTSRSSVISKKNKGKFL